MKTLVVVTHPNIESSVINKRWAEELRKYPEKYTVHELYKVYPNGNIDPKKNNNSSNRIVTLCCSSPFIGLIARLSLNNGLTMFLPMDGLTVQKEATN